MPDISMPLPSADILLVDDRPANLLALEVTLAGLGDNLVRASSGSEALDLLARRDFAVVLLDVRMPGLSGFEAAKRMRASDRTKHTPVIFLSGEESDEFPIAEAYRLGAVDYLLKPLVPDILRAKVAVFVDLFRKGEQVRALERERAQQALRAGEERLRRALSISTVGILFFRLDGRITDANAAFERMSGYTVEELRSISDWMVFTAPEYTGTTSRAAQELAGWGRTTPYEKELVRKDGSKWWGLCAPTRLAGSGRESECIEFIIDISDAKQTAAALRESDDRLRKLSDNLPSGFIYQIVSGPGGERRFSYVSRGVETVCGLSPAEIIADPAVLYGQVEEEDRARVASAELESFQTRQRFDCQFRIRTARGVRWLHCRSAPRELPGGGAVWDGVAIDVTDQRQADEALREADRRKDEFMAMLAHELRNPLAPLRNSIQILQLRGGDPAVVDQIRAMMERQIGHLARLVDDLLDVSRITRGKVRVRKERLDLSRLTRQAVSDHLAPYEAKGVALDVSAPETPVWVHGDATRLAQVVDNLLTNALKFTARGGWVSVMVAPRPDGRAELAVRDTGAGIDREMLPHLFEPFSQADHTLDRSSGGLGLGLAIVKGLAELHGGSVQAESEGLGQGAAFVVTLPTEAEPVALLTPPDPPVSAGKNLRILVVEDNRDAADSLRMLLEAYGYQVEVAYTGPDGVEAAAEYRPQVVICDIGLPGMDGYAVAGALRRDPATASSRLIALTGYGRDDDQLRAREAGFDDHLTKPADPAVVAAILAQVDSK